jgi:hypothetical protein
MKKLLMYSLLVGLIIVTSISCRKVTKTNPEFIGFWSTTVDGTNYVIDIDNDGQGRYAESSGALNGSEVKGSARFKNGVLKIGIKSLTVDKEPYVEGPFTLMDVEGKTFLKQ